MVGFVQTVPGKLALLLGFGALLCLVKKPVDVAQLVGILAALTFLPRHRRLLLVAGTLFYLRGHAHVDTDLLGRVWKSGGELFGRRSLFNMAMLASMYAFCWGYYTLARRVARGPMARPIATLLVGTFALLAVVSYVPLPRPVWALTWGFLIVLPGFMWFLCYSLADSRNPRTSPLGLQFGHYQPFWGGTATPFPKGAAYLRKIEATTPEALAVSQISGCKLLVWALLLKGLHAVCSVALWGRIPDLRLQGALATAWPGAIATAEAWGQGVPTREDLFAALAAGTPVPLAQEWFGLVCEFLMQLLRFAIVGHVIIATARMAGYKALRNTYNPLASASIAEFWNRYYYYFKELLVDFFFYPTYMRYFRKRPRLRQFCATVAAAGFGNIVYHFFLESEHILNVGVANALLGFAHYVIYATTLGVGIGISQLLSQGRSGRRHWLRVRVTAPAMVCLFYCVLGIFDTPFPVDLQDRFRLLGSLFGLE